MQETILEKLTSIENLLKGKDRPLTFEEAADYLDLSKSYLYKLTSSNKIPHYKPLGKRLFFDKSELDSWLMRNPVKTNTDIDQQANDYLVNGKGKE